MYILQALLLVCVELFRFVSAFLSPVISPVTCIAHYMAGREQQFDVRGSRCNSDTSTEITTVLELVLTIIQRLAQAPTGSAQAALYGLYTLGSAGLLNALPLRSGSGRLVIVIHVRLQTWIAD
jgi:hypothetical protein